MSRPNLRFGVFEIDFDAGELRKRGVRIGLQDQPFRVLCLLVEHPGQLVTREELRTRLWPADTFVDFDGSLNIAVLKVRHALGDSASHPRFIETVPRHGYRFVAPVEPSVSAGNPGPVEAPHSDLLQTAGDEPLTPIPSTRRRLGIFIAAAALLAALGLAYYFRPSHRSGLAPSPPAPVPLTAFPGFEANPSLSPNGDQVAFTWNGEGQDNFDIYVSTVARHSGAPLRLTTGPADEVAPSWSPDASKIAFVRHLGADRGELLVMPAGGGPEHKLGEIRSRELELMRLISTAWSPHGEYVSVSHRDPADAAEGIYLFSVTGRKRRLTPAAPKGYHGDYMPAFSPDGSFLAFCRLAGFSTSEIELLPLGQNLVPLGPLRTITSDRRWAVNPAWIGNGTSLLHVFSEHPTTRRVVRAIHISGSQARTQTVSFVDEPAEIAVAGAHLVYARRSEDTNIWRARIPGPGQPPATPERFIFSTRSDDKPSYSPDGSRIAFVSKRSGSDEIWVAGANGGNPVQMTHFGGPLVGAMNWSPDGQWIIFHARPRGQADIFVIPAAGGSTVRLTTDDADDVMPSFSRDGRFIYFSSRRSGDHAIWKMPASGGAATQLTGSRGTKPVESFDGKTIYYHTWPEPNAIFGVPVHGGDPVMVESRIHAFPIGFAITGDGLYYPAPPHSGKHRFIRFLRFSTGQDFPVAVAERPFYLGMSVSPDGRFVAFDQLDESGSDLMLIPNFKLQ